MVAGQMEPERGAAARPPPQPPRLVGRDLDHLGALRQRRRAVRGAIIRRVREHPRAAARHLDDDDGALQQVGRGEYVGLPQKVA